MDDEKISYSDIIQPDDSIDRLAESITDVNAGLAQLLGTVKAHAIAHEAWINEIKASTKKNVEAKDKVEKLAASTERLKAAQDELKFAMSETGKKVAWLKAQTVDVNKATVEYNRAIKMAQDSYDSLKKELNEMISVFKSLSAEERNSAAMGGELAADIAKLRARIAEIDATLRPHIERLSALEKATQKLVYVQSEEGQQLLKVREQISAVTAAHREDTAYAQTAAGSYNRLVLDLAAAVEQYRNLTEAERNNAAIGGALAKKIADMKLRISEIDAAMKPHVTTLSAVERAQMELKEAMSESGKQVAWLKAQTTDANKSTVEYQRYLQTAIGSYDRLKADLKDLTALYRSLSEAERADPSMGGALAEQIASLRARIKEMDAALKPHVAQLTEVEKAQQRLAYLESEEGQELLKLKARIAEVTSAHRQHKEVLDPLVAAHEKLAFANSKENQQLKMYATLTKEANRIAELNNQLARSAEGSYNKLAAQYELNKIKLNAMSAEERNAVDSGKKLEAETYAIYQQMIKLQEATGNYKLSVGHYEKSWSALGFSIAQVVRELPAAAINMNTFFLAISNNIPMMVDEINKLRAANLQLARAGKPTVNITRQIVKAFMSWNTWLVIVLSLLSMYGKQIIDFCKNVFKGRAAVISLTEALKNINAELEKTNGDYGKQIVTLRTLQEEWKGLRTQAEKTRWIADNKSEFDKLGIAVRSVNEAENAFVNNTEAIINALRLRAKAEAANKLAAEQYEKALLKRNEAETTEAVGPEGFTKFRAGLSAGLIDAGSGVVSYTEAADTFNKRKVQALNEEADAAEKTGDAYFDLAAGYNKAAREGLRLAGIEVSHKKLGGGQGRPPRDLTDTINKNQIDLQRKYEESVTKLTNDEYAKRRKAAADQVQDENNKLREMYRKNEVYVANVEGKYKALTEAQKKQIQQQQDWITKTIANNLKLLDLQLQKIQKEQLINSAKIYRNAINEEFSFANMQEDATGNKALVTVQSDLVRDQTALEASLAEERRLVTESLNLEYQLVLETNKKLLDAGDDQARSEDEIILEWNKKKLEIWSEYDKKILSIRQQNIDDQLVLVEKGTREELALLLAQNEIKRQIALAENAARPPEQQVDTAIINAKFDKSQRSVKAGFEMTGLEGQLEYERAKFDITKHNATEIRKFELEQEKKRWEEKIRLAESGGLDWSKVQIAAAKATVKGIERELSELSNFIYNVGQKGLGKTILETLGFDDDQIEAITNATNIVLDNIQEIFDAEVELAQKQVELAEERVDAAKSAYDAEIEARNNGYANNVATARKELEEERKKQKEKEAILAEAQKRQEAINTITQASSLITASAQLWSSLSGIPIVGPFLAAAAIATMFGSFAAAKIKARQVTASQEYGEGGLEFLEGGSHASGNDIDLGVSNKRKRRMRAEGGEALAIINKKRTRKYRNVLPDVIDSLNKGVFEDKYMRAFDGANNIKIIQQQSGIDLSQLEKDVQAIKEQNATRYYILPNGNMVIQHKNVKRIIKS